MNQPLIQLTNVFKAFGDNQVMKGVNLSIYQGEITTIIGKSGSGKSVLLKHIIGLLSPDKGHILFRDKPIDKMSKAEWNEYMRQVSFLFQNNALFDSLTVFENIDKHFDSVGGFSTRQGRDLFVTLLPFSELKESRQLLGELVSDLHKHGLDGIGAEVQIPAGSCFGFSVSAGLAEGKPGQGIESVIKLAESEQKPIVRFRCEMRR